MRRAKTSWRRVLFGLALALAGEVEGGCGFFSGGAPATPANAKTAAAAGLQTDVAVADAGTQAPSLRLHVQADAQSNRGGPLYVVVRKTDAAAFLTEGAAQVAKDVFPNNPDVVLATAVLWPDKQATLVVPRADPKESVGVYFLFSAPEDGKWRLLVADARTTCLDVVLGPESVRSFAPGSSC